MRVFLPLAVLGLAATGVTAGTLSTFGEWVNEYPDCARNCANQYYNEQFAGSCGQNAQSASMQCVCSAQGSSTSTLQHDVNKLATCIVNSCPMTMQQDNQIQHASNQLIHTCLAIANGKVSSAASSFSFNLSGAFGLAGLVGLLLF